MNIPFSYHRYAISSAVLLGLVLLYGLFFPYPWQKSKLSATACLLECQYCFALVAPGCDTVYFSEVRDDSILAGLTCMPSSVMQTSYGSAFWYGPVPLLHLCRGRLLTASTIAGADSVVPSLQSRIYGLLSIQDTLMSRREKAVSKEEQLLSYYMSTHDVADEGYNQMGEHSARCKQMQEDIRRVRTILDRQRRTGDVKVEYMATYIVYTPVDGDSSGIQSDTCHRIRVRQNVVQLQTLSGKMPKGCHSVAPSLMTGMTFASQSSRRRAVLAAYNYPVTKETSLTEMTTRSIKGEVWKEGGSYATSIPLLGRAEGSPLFDSRGSLIGIVCKNKIIPY